MNDITIRKLTKKKEINIPKRFLEKLGCDGIGQQLEIIVEYGKISIKPFNPNNVEVRPYVGIVRTLNSNFKLRIPNEYLEMLGFDIVCYYEVVLVNQKIIIRKKRKYYS